jgi:anti-anti-sigma regulatory factor
LRLAAFQDEVRSIFEITRLYRVFDISKTVEEALKEIRG